ncbi:hypothetical protein VVD49_07870 [Uliginosibacterium sp. H3]|uniref:CopC domain-containing protein n=1 Tax=Uliginosibacterium silvisoli TaxID=3114758 RepID=A0ABU6K124_9RHOO|nr:hypothetical protein [Uliginosibacterium sp. H3]
MKRTIRAVCAGLALAGAATLGAQAFAQQPGQPIPAEAKKATLAFSSDGQVGLNGKLSSLAVAAQIRDANTNLIVLPQALRGNYQARVILDNNGAIYRAWVIPDNK